jgi:DNA (cytosine-5)-methyltransferase 1
LNLPNVKPLSCLEIFAGCGGLSLGLHQSGVSNSRWAIELESSPARAFQKNFPNATVFEADCNTILDEVLVGKTEDKYGKKYPLKGEVEMIVGGPPCQGFSGMNRFGKGQYSRIRVCIEILFSLIRPLNDNIL